MPRYFLYCMICLNLALGVSANASPPGPIEEIQAHRVLTTQAIVIGKLLRRVEQDDEAYLAFENLRVVRGKEDEKILVFNHPQNSDAFDVPKDDIASLREGNKFLLVLQGDSPRCLSQWIPLAGVDEESTIKKQLQPYSEFDETLRLDPWDAVESSRPFHRVCMTRYYEKYATEKEVQTLLSEYVARKRLSPPQHELAWKAMERADAGGHFIADDLLSAMCELDLPDPLLRMGSKRILAHPDGTLDRLLIAALESEDDRYRYAALNALEVRKVSEAVPTIRAALDSGARYDAAEALCFQLGNEGVEELLRGCLEWRNDRRPRRLFAVLAEHVNESHIPTLRLLDDPTSPARAATELRLYAGDPDVPAEYLKLASYTPYNKAPYILRHAAALQPAARRILSKKIWVPSAAAVLVHTKDPQAGILIGAFLPNAKTGPAALHYLTPVVRKTHRTALERWASDDDPKVRFYALAALAQLGDDDARLKVIELMALAPKHETRQRASEHVAEHMDIPALIRTWESLAVSKPVDIELARHRFVLAKLKALDSK